MSGPIVAMGGAEFSMRPENEALHDYVLSHVETGSAPRICLLPTASGDPNDQIISFHAAMERRGCIASAISLFRLGVTPIDFAEHLLAQDVIYVTGGSMVNLLALWREHKIDVIMRTAHDHGIVLCGYSAGSMCWFEQGVSRGSGAPAPVDGLGLIPGSHCVHYSDDPERRDVYRKAVADGTIKDGLALDDHAAALIRDGAVVEAVRSKETSRAFRVRGDDAADDGVTEEEIESRLLPAPDATEAQLGLEEMRELRMMRRGGGSGRLGRR
ncbi:MAG: peptidase E [Solirubrobacterales bacterium]